MVDPEKMAVIEAIRAMRETNPLVKVKVFCDELQKPFPEMAETLTQQRVCRIVIAWKIGGQTCDDKYRCTGKYAGVPPPPKKENKEVDFEVAAHREMDVVVKAANAALQQEVAMLLAGILR